jgi:DNA polymerase elongation subunit (family B)
MLRRAVAIAESKGFKLIHGIVDSMWLKKPNASDAEYNEICAQIERELGLPISFEGRYKWIVFLNSHVNPKVPVLNRYYGVFEDGTLKVRGIDLRRHDTPEVIRKCQSDMLTVLSQAEDSQEFKELIPRTLAIVKSYVSALRTHKAPIEQLVVEKRLSKSTKEYTNLVPQVIAAAHLAREGQKTRAGQTVSYVITDNEARIASNRALPAEFLTESTCYDSEWYVNLILSSVTNLFLPFGYDVKSLRDWSSLS